MFKSFRRIPAHSEGSDCTAPYILDIIGKPSVNEVIADIKQSNEWGSIEVYSKGRNSVVSSMSYGNGMSGGSIDHGYDNHIVIGGNSVGGWSNMDYTLYIN